MATKPAYRLFQIEPRGPQGDQQKHFWREVGVAWQNADRSLNLDFAVIPLIGTHSVQARPYVEQAEPEPAAVAEPKPARRRR